MVYIFGRDLETKSSKLRKLSFLDPLTGIYNRRYFFEIVPHYEKLKKRYNRTYSLLLIDIDNFKKINDTKRHDVGDSVLRTIASILQNRTRSSDIVARYGGEEFIVLLPETMLDNAVAFSEDVRKLVENIQWKEIDFRVTISIGVSSATQDYVLENILKQADQALYRAKKSGKNRIYRFAN